MGASLYKMTSMLKVNGHRLYVAVKGSPSGLPVVLLHHGLGSVRAWKGQVPALLAAGYRTLAYDRWGYGKSDPRPQLDLPYFREDLADLEAVLHNYVTEPFYLVGHSDGGKLALYYTALHPEQVLKLVVVSAHIYLEHGMEDSIQAVKQTYETDEEFRAKFGRVHGSQADSVFYNWFNGWSSLGASRAGREWDMRPQISQIHCPTLVVQGVEDEHASPQHAQAIAEAIPGAELWLVPGAGHMLPQEAEETFNQRLLAFLGTPLRADREGEALSLVH